MEQTSDDSVLIRAAHPEDAQGIARVLVETFLDTYRGLVQDRSLNKLSIPGSSTRWEQVISSHGAIIILVAVDASSNEVLGYAYGGSCRDASLPDGELYHFYILPKAQRHHIGRRLFCQFARTLWSEGYDSMIVRVLDGTPAMSFYQKMNGLPFQRDQVYIDGRPYLENSFR